MAGMPNRINSEPNTTNKKYAKAIEKAVENFVNGQPYVEEESVSE
jgi:hypothetical protein